MNDGEGCIAMLVALVLGMLLGGWMGTDYGTHVERRAAIDAGMGHYACDPVTGVQVFTYGDATCNKPALPTD